MVLYSFSLVDFYLYIFDTIILYEITLKLCKNNLLNLLLLVSVISSVFFGKPKPNRKYRNRISSILIF
jgi:hypothetical protein